MAKAKFPIKRPDGSFTVGIRWSGPGSSLDALQRSVTAWIAKSSAGPLKITSEFVTEPRVSMYAPEHFEVVLEGRPGSRRWNDLMADLAKDVAASGTGLEFEGFYDAVAGHFHPASTNRPDLLPS